MSLAETMDHVARGVEVVGIVTLVVGLMIALLRGAGAVDPSLENVAVLGLIVLIRTFLSFSLEVEIDGTWPWRRAAVRQAGD